ncbi:MAG TPA: pentapeptide repeat-containing protein [Ktedonobacteraceae bacterium]
MPADSELWIPPLSLKAQKRINGRQKYQRLVKWTGFPEKTLWDWLQLLSVLAIPVVITGGTLWFSAVQSLASFQVSENQHQADIQSANEQQQETALQTYLDRMSDLLLNSKLRESQLGDEVRNVARARTLTILPQLNSTRKGELVRFLKEAGLIDQESVIVSLVGADLGGASLDGVNLSGTYLSRVDLSWASLDGADLSHANLVNTNLVGADLSEANLDSSNLRAAALWKAKLVYANLNQASLSGAWLSEAYLSYANFSGADLSGAAFLDTTLSHANLMRTDLRDVNFGGLKLNGNYIKGTDLSYANLENAEVTPEQLKQAYSLKGAIMPDGSKHP